MRGELGHRLKNLLTIVQSLVAQTLRTSRSTEQARDIIQDRIAALAAAQDILIEALGEQSDVESVVRAAIAPYNNEARFELDGTPVQLAPRAALLLALTMHELSTNAVKYGALSVAGGRFPCAGMLRTRTNCGSAGRSSAVPG